MPFYNEQMSLPNLQIKFFISSILFHWRYIFTSGFTFQEYDRQDCYTRYSSLTICPFQLSKLNLYSRVVTFCRNDQTLFFRLTLMFRLKRASIYFFTYCRYFEFFTYGQVFSVLRKSYAKWGNKEIIWEINNA